VRGQLPTLEELLAAVEKVKAETEAEEKRLEALRAEATARRPAKQLFLWRHMDETLWPKGTFDPANFERPKTQAEYTAGWVAFMKRPHDEREEEEKNRGGK